MAECYVCHDDEKDEAIMSNVCECKNLSVHRSCQLRLVRERARAAVDVAAQHAVRAEAVREVERLVVHERHPVLLVGRGAAVVEEDDARRRRGRGAVQVRDEQERARAP